MKVRHIFFPVVLVFALFVVSAVRASEPAESDTEPSVKTKEAKADSEDQAKQDEPAKTEPAATDDESPFAKKEKKKKTRADWVAELDDQELTWYGRIKALAEGPLSSTSMVEYRQGEKQLLAITDPVALKPMGLAIYTPNTRWRSSFLMAVTQFAQSSEPPQDKVAVAYLSDMAVGDKSPILRGKARAAILHDDTPKYDDQLKYRLTTFRRAEVRERAAELLADLKAVSGMANMIEMLTTEELRVKGAWIESYNVMMDIRAANVGIPTFRQVPISAATPALGIATATIEVPTVRITEINTTVSAPAGVRIDYDYEIATRKHPGVLAALKRLTGQDFGYNKEAWYAWLRARQHEKNDEYDVNWGAKE